jgi:hypothetical protein
MGKLCDLFINQYPYTDFHELNADWIITSFKTILTEVDSLDDWRSQHEHEYEELKKLIDDLTSGNWSQDFIDTLISWYKDNIIDIMGSMARTVHFGLTNDGYFCAFIPSSWSFLHFDTISDPNDPLYGHLIVEYD